MISARTTRHVTTVLVVFLCFAAKAVPQDTPNPATPNGRTVVPVLRNTCLITSDVSRLVKFYNSVLGISAKMRGNDYAEFQTGATVLAIFSSDAQEKYIAGSAQPASNKSAILEFEVDDVDAQFARLQNVVKQWVKPPSTQPWGTRSIYFRDPDGNLIDFYAWIKAH